MRFRILCALAFSSLISSSAQAGSYYDDWDVERVPDQIKVTKLFFGQTHCEAYIQRYYGLPSERKDFSQNVSKSLATTDIRPTFTVMAPYTDQYGTQLYRQYSCKSVGDLPYSYNKEEVLSWKNKYTPRQPFPTFVGYEYGSCNQSTRRGAIDIGLPATGANNMKVFVSSSSNNFPDIKIYDGVPKGFIGYDYATSSDKTKRLRVKLDDGSSHYLTAHIPACSTGNDLAPR
ncbi:hypothetical protein [Shewanella sp. 0m-4]